MTQLATPKLQMRKWFLGVMLLLSTLLWIPLPAEFSSQKSITYELNNSYMECCRRMSDGKLHQRLIQPAGVPTLIAKKEESSNAAAWNPSSIQWAQLAKGFKTSEKLEVEGDSELGPLHLALLQETTFKLDALRVHTWSLRPDQKLSYYSHYFALSPEKKNTKAEVTIEIKVRLWIPWIYRSVAADRLKRSVQSQVEGFVDRLKDTLTR